MKMSEDCSTDETKKTRRPWVSRFHQQDLYAWQPLLNAKNVFPFFLAIGLAFLCIAILLLVTSNSVSEVIIPYTDCVMEGSTTKCSEKVMDPRFFSRYERCKCRVRFNLSSPFEGQVFMYYGLSNFYQNHRQYVKSRDAIQLVGRDSILKDNCEPYKSIEVIRGNVTVKKNIAPCGLIANSIFNDTFKLFFRKDGGSEKIEIGLLGKDISWTTDRSLKYGIPSNETWAKTYKPPNWPKPAYERTPDAYKGDEDLHVWMLTAALPNFRKLHRRIDHKSNDNFRTGLPKGFYELEVLYAYPVTSFRGEKAITLTTTTWLGGRNPTLGIAYLVVGIIQTLCGIFFLVLHIQTKKRVLEIMVVDGKITYRTSISHVEPRPVSLSVFRCFSVNIKDSMATTSEDTNNESAFMCPATQSTKMV